MPLLKFMFLNSNQGNRNPVRDGILVAQLKIDRKKSR
jgi:hypothetical protein